MPVEEIEEYTNEAIRKKWNACTQHMKDVPLLIEEIKRLRKVNKMQSLLLNSIDKIY